MAWASARYAKAEPMGVGTERSRGFGAKGERLKLCCGYKGVRIWNLFFGSKG